MNEINLPAQVEALIKAELGEGTEVRLSGEDCSLSGVVVSASFENKSRLEAQRMVMQSLTQLFQEGRLHALSIKTQTPKLSP